MTLAHLGIDISKDKFDVALLRADKLRHKVFPNRPEGFAQLAAWLAKQGVTELHVCLEATGTYSEGLATFLHDAGHPVSLVNPACIKAFAQSQLARTKTDKVDAGVIARFCATQSPPRWAPPAPEVRQLQALTRRLESLAEMRQQEVNRLAGGPQAPEVIASLETHIEYLDREISETKRLVRDHIESHPELKRRQELSLQSRDRRADCGQAPGGGHRLVRLRQRQAGGGIRRADAATTRLGQQCAREAAPVKDREREIALRPLYAGSRGDQA